MNNIFDINATYRESCAENYNRGKLFSEFPFLSESKYRGIRESCKKLCPKTFGEQPKEPKKRFIYFQFLAYIITKKQDGFSVLHCVENPSERYLSVYADMIKEIRRNVSEATRTVTDGPDLIGAEPTQPNKGWFDDSIHDLQQRADLISRTLIYAYNFGDEALKILAYRERLFLKEMERLAKQNYQEATFENCWDELYFRLNYARCIYWERDLLSAYQNVEEIVLKLPSIENKLSAMWQEKDRKLTPEDDCFLCLNKERQEIMEVREHFEDNVYDLQPDNIDSYKQALYSYVKSHVREIAEFTFCKQKVSRSEKNSILNHIYHACEYLKMELQRYGRSRGFTKVKLISALQVIFMVQSDANIAPRKKGTLKIQNSKGSQREKNTLSSSYINSNIKEPYYLQVICLLTDYQFAWNVLGTSFSQKYLETSISILKSMLVMGYQFGMANLQLHAEKVLFAAMNTLIPDEDGEDQVSDCIKALQLYRFQGKVARPLPKSLLEFGKFYKLFGGVKIIDLIKKALFARESMPTSTFDISLNEATEDSVRMHSLTLELHYYSAIRGYEIKNFFIIERKYLKAENKFT